MIKINNQINARDARASDIIHWYKWFNDEKNNKMVNSWKNSKYN